MVEQISYDTQAVNILVELSERNPTNSTTIMNLGQSILEIPGVGLRGIPNHSRDVAFIRRRGNSTKSFATFVTPTFRGHWTKTPIHSEEIVVQVNINHDRQVVLKNEWLENLEFPRQGGGFWHFGRVCSDGGGIQDAFQITLQAHESWS